MSKSQAGINVHLYPSDFLHETRIEKISLLLKNLSFFQSIWLVGISSNNLPDNELLNPGVQLYRVGRSTMRRSFVSKMLAFASYYLGVIFLLRNVSVKCINAHSLSVLPLAVLLKLIKGSVLIYDTHELETETHSLTGMRKKFAKFVELRFIRFADSVFCVSKEISEWYSANYNIPEPITILNSSESASINASNLLRDKFGINPDQKIFLYFGIMGPGRGIEILLDAFNSINNNNVMIFVGYGELCDSIIKSPAYGRNIFYMPPVPKQEIPSIAASADVGICIVSPSCLSYYYCMPNKLFEYLSSGLPVLVSPCLSLQHFIEEYDVGAVVTDMTSAGVIDKINALAKSDLTAMKIRAERVAREHSWTVQEQRLKSAYQNIFNQ